MRECLGQPLLPSRRAPDPGGQHRPPGPLPIPRLAIPQRRRPVHRPSSGIANAAAHQRLRAHVRGGRAQRPGVGQPEPARRPPRVPPAGRLAHCGAGRRPNATGLAEFCSARRRRNGIGRGATLPGVRCATVRRPVRGAAKQPSRCPSVLERGWAGPAAVLPAATGTHRQDPCPCRARSPRRCGGAGAMASPSPGGDEALASSPHRRGAGVGLSPQHGRRRLCAAAAATQGPPARVRAAAQGSRHARDRGGLAGVREDLCHRGAREAAGAVPQGDLDLAGAG